VHARIAVGDPPARGRHARKAEQRIARAAEDAQIITQTAGMPARRRLVRPTDQSQNNKLRRDVNARWQLGQPNSARSNDF